MSIKLEEHDKLNPLWLKLKEHLTGRLGTLRAQNDSASLTPEQTQALRGRIAEVKALLDLEKERPVIEAGSHD